MAKIGGALDPGEYVVERAKLVVPTGDELEFVGHGDGGPTVILSNTVRDAWKGVEAHDEGSDDDLACESEETFEFEDLDAFCLQEVGATAVVSIEQGVLLPRWVGADSNAAVLGVERDDPKRSTTTSPCDHARVAERRSPHTDGPSSSVV